MSAPHALEWATAARPLQTAASGDLHVVDTQVDRALFGVIDGLGHGADAQAVAQRAAATIIGGRGSLVDVFTACHSALRGTRGAAMTLATLTVEEGRGVLRWGGIGNVDAARVRGTSRAHLVLRGGVVGDRMPALRVATITLERGDLLVFLTDGVRSEAIAAMDPYASDLQALATEAIAGFAKAVDDALVLVARWPGPAGAS